MAPNLGCAYTSPEVLVKCEFRFSLEPEPLFLTSSVDTSVAGPWTQLWNIESRTALFNRNA